VREYVGAPVFLAHRLDRATSGVLLLARSREIAAELGRQFMARSVEKSYLAIVRVGPRRRHDRLRFADSVNAARASRR